MPLKQQKSLFDPVICKTPDAPLQEIEILDIWICRPRKPYHTH